MNMKNQQYAISQYPDVDLIYSQLDALIQRLSLEC